MYVIFPLCIVFCRVVDLAFMSHIQFSLLFSALFRENFWSLNSILLLLSSTDSDLEVLNHNPTDGSFAPWSFSSQGFVNLVFRYGNIFNKSSE